MAVLSVLVKATQSSSHESHSVAVTVFHHLQVYSIDEQWHTSARLKSKSAPTPLSHPINVSDGQLPSDGTPVEHCSSKTVMSKLVVTSRLEGSSKWLSCLQPLGVEFTT